MLKLLLHWVVSAITLLIISHFLAGFVVRDLQAALIAALVIGLLNATWDFCSRSSPSPSPSSPSACFYWSSTPDDSAWSPLRPGFPSTAGFQPSGRSGTGPLGIALHAGQKRSNPPVDSLRLYFVDVACEGSWGKGPAESSAGLQTAVVQGSSPAP